MLIDPQTAFIAERIMLLVLSGLYGLAVIFYCPPDVKRKELIRRIGYGIHIFALVVHSFLLFARIQSTGHAPLSNLHETLLALSWATSFVFLVFSFKRESYGYGRAAGFVSWLLVFISLITHLVNQAKVLPRYLVPVVGTSPWFEAHVATALIAYACFILAFFPVLTSIKVEEKKRLERRAVAEMYMWPGMFLFTSSLILGAFGTQQAWGRWWIWNPKSALSVVVWGIFFLALASRGHKRLARKAFPWLVILGLLALIFSYLFPVIFPKVTQGFHHFL